MGKRAHRNDLRGRSRLRGYLLIAVAVSAAAIIIIAFLTMDRRTFKAVASIDVLSFALALGLVVAKLASESARFQLIIRSIGRTLPFWRTTKATLGGAFVGSLTPVRSGTIPAQVFFLTRYGLSGGQATAVSTIAAAVSILLLTASLPFVFIISASRIHVGFGVRSLLVMAAIIGFFAFLFAAYSMSEPERFSRLVTRLTPRRYRSRPGFLRFRDRLAGVVKDFSESLLRLFEAPRRLLAGIILLTIAFWASEVFLGALVLKGFGYPQFFWKAVAAQLIVESILPFTPVPGESGIAEAAFAGVFGIFVRKDILALVTLAWRFFIFYLPILGLWIAFMLATRDAGRLPTEKERDRRRAPTAEKEGRPSS